MHDPVLGGVIGGAVGISLGVVTAALAASRSNGRRAGGSAAWYGLTVVGALAGAVVGAVLNQPTLEEQLDRGNPVFATLHQHFPGDYRGIVAAIRAQLGDHINGALTPAEISRMRVSVSPLISAILKRNVAAIDEDNDHTMLLVTLDEATVLKAREPGDCVAVLSGKPVTGDWMALMSPEIQEEDRDETVQALQQIATHPAAPAVPITKPQLTALAMAAFRRLPPPEQARLRLQLGKPLLPGDTAAELTMCDFDIEMVRSALAGPPGTVRGFVAYR